MAVAAFTLQCPEAKVGKESLLTVNRNNNT